MIPGIFTSCIVCFFSSGLLPNDGPNQPVGTPAGINPGRVVWIWNPDATNENCKSTFDEQDWYWKPENTDEKIVAGRFYQTATGSMISFIRLRIQ